MSYFLNTGLQVVTIFETVTICISVKKAFKLAIFRYACMLSGQRVQKVSSHETHTIKAFDHGLSQQL